MKSLMWVILLVIVLGIIGFVIYESSPTTATLPSTATSTASANLPEIIPGTPSVMYQDPQYGFNIYYPSTTVLESTGFDGYLPLTHSPVIGFALDPSLFQGTNLTDAGVYIGATTTPAIVASCNSAADSTEIAASSTVMINGTGFSEFDSTGAAAGNTYQEKIFRGLKNNACFEIVELLHSGNIANYPTGSVTQFDQAKFSGILDGMVSTFSFSK